MRFSSKREAIMQVMRSTKCHPDAEWVYRKVRESVPGISLGTVYRNLRELSASGVLHTVETESGSLHFDADTSAHAHFVCTECGSISDVYDLQDCTPVLTERGYTVHCVKTVAYGVCPHCLQAHANKLS